MNIYAILIETFEFLIVSLSSIVFRLAVKNIVTMYGLPTCYTSQTIWHICLIILYAYILIFMWIHLSYFRLTDLRNKHMANRTQNMKIVGFIIAFLVGIAFHAVVYYYFEYLNNNM